MQHATSFPTRRYPAILLWVLFVSAAILSACRPVQPAPAVATRPTAVLPPVAVAPDLPYTNPVFDSDFPDPFILTTPDAYYAYATNAGGKNVQVLRSTDLFTWERAGTKGDALPELPAWAAPFRDLTWAPSVLQRGDQYILYYVTRFRQSGRQCISYAIAGAPDGPFIDPNSQPFVCQLDEGGSIDPEPFVDEDGTLYLLWKSDANAIDRDANIYSQRLSDDGRTLLGQPVRLITRDQEWELPLVENPSLTYHDGKYHLIYSANWWEGPDYVVGYAICESPLGPCTKPLDGPWFEIADPTLGQEAGPGGASWVHDHDGNLWMAYHAWRYPYTSYAAAGQRRLSLARVEFVNGMPELFRPEPELFRPEPAPAQP